MTDDAPRQAQPRIVLLGMMGSGKSSVGEALSRRSGWPFVDNDALVQRSTGRTARQLLTRSGEAAMRAAEAAALDTALSLPEPVIVATAAGTILDEGNRKRMADGGFVVWLRAPADVLAARAVGAAHRPWLDEDPVGWFRRIVSERDPLYREVADLQVDTSTTDPESAAETILRTLHGPIPSEHVEPA